MKTKAAILSILIVFATNCFAQADHNNTRIKAKHGRYLVQGGDIGNGLKQVDHDNCFNKKAKTKAVQSHKLKSKKVVAARNIV